MNLSLIFPSMFLLFNAWNTWYLVYDALEHASSESFWGRSGEPDMPWRRAGETRARNCETAADCKLISSTLLEYYIRKNVSANFMPYARSTSKIMLAKQCSSDMLPRKKGSADVLSHDITQWLLLLITVVHVVVIIIIIIIIIIILIIMLLMSLIMIMIICPARHPFFPNECTPETTASTPDAGPKPCQVKELRPPLLQHI